VIIFYRKHCDSISNQQHRFVAIFNVFQGGSSKSQGNVIAYPTEGVWGLGCDPLNEAAVLKLISLRRHFLGHIQL